ncbi:MAG: alpha-mannosidase [Calditrichaeota bacterium]|nr:hypothetical protein [Calditrichota bacterium]RQW04575.1 MAG: alpha-mannosidase [Calditrichota bacterium]
MIKPTIHLICNAHLDPVWQWRWEEGAAETLSTFNTALRLLDEFPDWIFNHNEAVLYMWVKKFAPELFEAIQEKVKAGRWAISGGWYLQPDVNLPGTESLFRHIAVGRDFFRKHFGAEPKVAYNFDSFGHSGGLPQILKLTGYQMYIHMRPQSQDLALPSDLYRWRGVDGSEILGYRISIGLYHTEFENLRQRLGEGAELALQLKRDVPVFWGIGNHGGGATRTDLETIHQFMNEEKRVHIMHSTPDRFYNSIKDKTSDIPLVEGGLQRVFTGCYTSLSRLKRASQKSLAEIIQTELTRAATWWHFGLKYPEDQLDSIWKDHLFNDFHDILPGSCTEPAEKDAIDLYGKVSENLRHLRLEAMQAYNIGKYQSFPIPVTILNTNHILKKVPVEVEFMISHRPKWTGSCYIKLFDSSGKEIPCQEEQPESLLPFNDWRRKICFTADLPAVGRACYTAEAFEGRKSQSVKNPVLFSRMNKKSGLIHTLHNNDLPNYLEGELLKSLVIEDTGDSWGTDCWQYRNVVGEFNCEPESQRILHQGPIRNIYQTIHRYNNSKVVYHTYLYSDWPVVEFRLWVHWNEIQKRLKLSIPTIFKQENIRVEIPGGFTDRPADGEEHIHGRWLLMEKEIGRKMYGLAVIHNGLNGFDFKEGELRLSALRSAAYCHEKGFKIEKYPARRYMDQGIHDIRVLVVVDEPARLKKRVTAFADWISSPPFALAHFPVAKPDSLSLLNISRENIRILACKKSRKAERLMIRLQEMSGEACETELKIDGIVKKISLAFRGLEVKTIGVERNGSWQEVDAIQEC